MDMVHRPKPHLALIVNQFIRINVFFQLFEIGNRIAVYQLQFSFFMLVDQADCLRYFFERRGEIGAVESRQDMLR